MSPTELIPISQPGPLTEMDRFVFESYGYLLIEDVLSLDECKEVLDASIRIHKGHPKDHLMQLGRGFETEPSIERLIDHPAILPKIRGILGDRFVLQAAFCTIQPAGSESIGWHRDGSGSFEYELLGYPAPLLQLRASYNLTDQMNDFMGNMMMIPGSHRSPVRLPESVHDKIYACPIQHIIRVRPGAVLIFHNAVFHSPMPNRMNYDRYNMHFIYSPPWLRRSDREATDPAFLERTTPLRRALMGDYERPDTPFGGGLPRIPFEEMEEAKGGPAT
jgi:ectoine hydroxylase